MRRTVDHGWGRIGLILLGAGRSTRFGRNKLAEPLLGVPMIRRTAAIYAALPFARRVAVVGPSMPRLDDLGYSEGSVTEKGNPQSASLAAGIRLLDGVGMDGIMVALGDMPLVDLAHLEALRHGFESSGLVCSSIGSARSPPAIFPIAAREQLMTLVGDQGARNLLADAICVPSNDSVLMDIDSMADFSKAAAILQRSFDCGNDADLVHLPFNDAPISAGSRDTE